MLGLKGGRSKLSVTQGDWTRDRFASGSTRSLLCFPKAEEEEKQTNKKLSTNPLNLSTNYFAAIAETNSKVLIKKKIALYCNTEVLTFFSKQKWQISVVPNLLIMTEKNTGNQESCNFIILSTSKLIFRTMHLKSARCELWAKTVPWTFTGGPSLSLLLLS